MGATLDSGNKDSVDVQLNIVPFIDLMSCLTAFLLVTAVWSNFSSLDVAPQGVSKGVDGFEDDRVYASVHITDEAIWVGISRVNEFQKIEKVAGEHDWQTLGTVLAKQKKRSFFVDRTDIQVAADDAVLYQNLVATIDTAVAAGWETVGVTDPNQLSARRQL